MFPNLVNYHVHKCNLLPANDAPSMDLGQALAYQYILAGNGVFIRAETRFFEVTLPIATCIVRGLEPLPTRFHLKVPRIPTCLLDSILTDARRARRPDGGLPDNGLPIIGLNEVLYQFHHHGQTVQVRKPAQHATTVSVLAAGVDDPAIMGDLHSHGNMSAFFSRMDDADEQAAKVYAVIGKLDTAPELRLRVGAYGYWLPLPVTAVFTGNGPFKDLHEERNHDK